MERRLAAIFAADVAGYSRLIGVDEEGTLERLRAHRRELIDPKIAEHQGRIVKTTGDGVLVEFASPVKAVRCAIEVQHGMVDRNVDVPREQRIEFRIGINLGDVVVEDGDIYGDGVNVAARLENLAEPGAVYISRAVRDFVDDHAEMTLEDLGEKPLKNIAKPVRVFRIAAPDRAVAVSAPVGSPAPPHKPSIAVLPFANMSGDAEQEYFTDGMTEDLITDLSKVSSLFVIARNSSFAYKGRSAKVQEIGHDLGVRFVLEGSIRKAGNRVRITAQLIDAGSGGHLWAERFDRDLTDIFSMEDEVVEKIVWADAGPAVFRRMSSGCARANRSAAARGRGSRKPGRCTCGRSSSIRISRRRMRDCRWPRFRTTSATGRRIRRRRSMRRSDGRAARSNWTIRSR